ncbi:YicC family protein [Clostridium sp. M62/1]|uniref:YicC/YloC family endoribonuclease n=1 Tax=Clostridium sp. M62/1 TaxID=411486 RepID=UPI0001C34E58|nr:YicC/YloC family endoribonuclease [Clostridium sp. M62/1]UEB77321.1 YicC family protein [Clostridium sp. M62/1]
MLRSMTGFGRCEITTEEYRISVEMKAVNHRYLDLGIKMPKKFNYFEASIRSLLKQYIQRGKVDLFITYEDYTEEKMALKYNRSLASEYMEYFAKMAEQFHIENDITVSDLARYPDVLVMEQVPEDEEHMWAILKEAVEEAASRFVETRVTEGENLKADLLGKLDYMDRLVAEIEERSPKIVAEYRAKLEDKVKELLQGSAIDEARIATEVTIFADKICTDEETVRLKSHIEATRAELLSGGSVGRKLDFIAQEMNREANTILSKANDLEVSDRAIALKTEIEKVREQIQNIE